ncbi:hypothetical protein CHS0354_035491 [Potamilus streckersoni]|uniref:Uncharacterized protein n=1 Tax=Potamilus streckersoni TaxID=2493646 RepID=A0AAE0RVI3_9BIVA|nr:hypothetical protein CHS0354_035491 [Potamilus streckersoni]
MAWAVLGNLTFWMEDVCKHKEDFLPLNMERLSAIGLIPDDEESQEILNLYDCAISGQNMSAMRYKGKFLMLKGIYKEAIYVFEELYRSLELMDMQQEVFDRRVKAVVQSCHARCLRLLSDNFVATKQDKELLWPSIELLVDKRMEGKKPTKDLKHAVHEMLNLLQRDTKSE